MFIRNHLLVNTERTCSYTGDPSPIDDGYRNPQDHTGCIAVSAEPTGSKETLRSRMNN